MEDKNRIGRLIIASGVVWAGVIIACYFVLKDTPYTVQINQILTGGAVFHLLFIWNPLAKMRKIKR